MAGSRPEYKSAVSHGAWRRLTRSNTILSKYGELMVDVSSAYPQSAIGPMHSIRTVMNYQSTGASGVHPVAGSAVNLSIDFCSYNIRSNARCKLHQRVTTVLTSLRGYVGGCKPGGGGRNCPRAVVPLPSPICGPSSSSLLLSSLESSPVAVLGHELVPIPPGTTSALPRMLPLPPDAPMPTRLTCCDSAMT